jgi:hypothetical protein
MRYLLDPICEFTTAKLVLLTCPREYQTSFWYQDLPTSLFGGVAATLRSLWASRLVV